MFKKISGLFSPSAEKIATTQLADAKRELLEAQRGLEHYEAIVPMLEKRVDRLAAAIPDALQ